MDRRLGNGAGPHPGSCQLLESRLIISGAEVDALQRATFNCLHPISRKIASQASAATEDDARAAAISAASAFPAWSNSDAAERSRLLNRAADLMLERADDFVQVIAQETGGSEGWARFNCQLGAEMFRHAAKLADYARETVRPGRDDTVQSLVVRQPAGVVLGIAPWNAPVILAVRATATPLACGNTVVLKASELCPKTHAMVVKILNDAGLPPGAANLVTNAPEDASKIVEALVGHPAIRRINFTGSTRVGRMVAEVCARHLKPVVLELSGKAPLLVLDDADVERAAEAAAFGAFFNQGQICISTERLIVDNSVADEFVERLGKKAADLAVGDPRKAAVEIGSMISNNSADRVGELVTDALDKGARLVTGGEIQRSLMQPTVLDDINSSMRIYHEESFGPVASVIRVHSDAEAVSVANDTRFGLAASVFSRDIGRAKSIAAELETGICHINGPTVYDDPAMPFGGLRESGYGKMGGEEAVHEFTELRWITIQDPPEEYPI